MVKMAMIFRNPADESTFDTHYVETLALMEKLPGLIRRQACMVLGSPAGKSQYYRLLEIYFEDYSALDSALVSPEGRRAGASLMAFAGRDTEIIFADVFEE